MFEMSDFQTNESYELVLFNESVSNLYILITTYKYL